MMLKKLNDKGSVYALGGSRERANNSFNIEAFDLLRRDDLLDWETGREVVCERFPICHGSSAPLGFGWNKAATLVTEANGRWLLNW